MIQLPESTVLENEVGKIFVSAEYNFTFNKRTGFFARWGATYDDDPPFSPYGPELLDIEISTICSKGCPWCYKSNTKDGENMSLRTFGRILDKLPSTVTQIAFGIGDFDANPDLFAIFGATRDAGIIPNVTIKPEKMTDKTAKRLMDVCGAVAVSMYGMGDTNRTIKQLSMFKRAGQQINIHAMFSHETFPMMEYLTNCDMEGEVDALVFLMLKQKGDRNDHTPATEEEFRIVMDNCLDRGVKFGMDSCASHRFIAYLKARGELELYQEVIEPCEGTLFSYYISVDGKGYPCSFLEGTMPAVDVLSTEDFLNDVWYRDTVVKYRETLIDTGRRCPVYDI